MMCHQILNQFLVFLLQLLEQVRPDIGVKILKLILTILKLVQGMYYVINFSIFSNSLCKMKVILVHIFPYWSQIVFFEISSKIKFESKVFNFMCVHSTQTNCNAYWFKYYLCIFAMPRMFSRVSILMHSGWYIFSSLKVQKWIAFTLIKNLTLKVWYANS